MSTFLSDILERLRPTGTPGAATAGAGERDIDERQHEIADVAATLADFQVEADAIVADARRQAKEIHERSLDSARRIEDGVPDRVASAVGDVERRRHDDTTIEQQRILEQATTDAERVRQISDAKVSHVADTATALVWAAVLPAAALPPSARTEN